MQSSRKKPMSAKKDFYDILKFSTVEAVKSCVVDKVVLFLKHERDPLFDEEEVISMALFIDSLSYARRIFFKEGRWILKSTSMGGGMLACVQVCIS